MDLSPVVSREEWLVAREELLRKEKELTKAHDAVNAARRALPVVKIEADYTFEGPDGTVSLADLFDGRPQLIVYHFMFDPDWDQGCSSCSFLVDNIGHLGHLHSRDTTLTAVSRAPYAKIAAYKERMGWTVPWVSSSGTSFNYDFGVTMDASVAPIVYNYKDLTTLQTQGLNHHMAGEQHGMSVFARNADGVFHTYSTYGRGPEPVLGTTPTSTSPRWAARRWAPESTGSRTTTRIRRTRHTPRPTATPRRRTTTATDPISTPRCWPARGRAGWTKMGTLCR